MKVVLLLLSAIFLISCSESELEELAFRKTIEYDLVELCGKEDQECIAAVKSQTKGCMEKSNWRRYLENSEDESELARFTTEFYACVVDKNGNPYFEPNI